MVTLVVGILVGAGVGYAAFHCNDEHGNSGGDSGDVTYWYYIYFGDDSAMNKWYSATGADAADAFGKAMKAANMEYELSKGYVVSIGGVDGWWSVYNYTYKETTKTAAENSILSPVNVNDNPNDLAKSNGWLAFAGYDVKDDERFKIWQTGTEIFFFSIWTETSSVWGCPNPVTTNLWMTDSTGPFASA